MKIVPLDVSKDLIPLVILASLYKKELSLDTPGSWNLFLNNILKQKTFVIKDDNGTIIGFVNFGHNTKNFTDLDYIRAVAVYPSIQGKGIGKKLIYFALSKTSRPTWIMVNQDNKKMLNLLTDLGFHPFIKDNKSIGLILP